MGYYFTVLILLCFCLLYILVEGMFKNYLDEFGLDKTQPLTIDIIKKVIDLVMENKICSKFKKPLESELPRNDFFYSIKGAYFILSCILCAFLGYINGVRKQKKCSFTIEQNVNHGNNLSISDNNEPSTCSLCLNVFKPRIVLLPCRHICICTNCWIQFYEESEHHCPICRGDIVEVMDVYST